MTDYVYNIGGVTFGAGTPYRVGSITGLGSPGWRDGDINLPAGHGSLPVVDYLSKRTVGFELMCIATTPAAAVDLMRILATAWTMPNADLAGTTSPLQIDLPGYAGGGYQLIGRPRRFDPVLTDLASSVIRVVCDYVAHDPLLYGDPVTVTLGLGGLVLTDSSGRQTYANGIVAPLVAPLITGANPTAPAGSGGTARSLVVTGSYQTWPYIDILGPCLGPRVSIGPTSYSFPALNLAVGEHLTIETHPARRQVVSFGYAPRYTYLEAGSRLSAVQPGTYDVQFSARTYDVRATATVTIRPALIA